MTAVLEPGGRSPRVADRDRSALLLIDLQEAYRGKLLHEKRVVGSSLRLIEAASILGIPTLVTEQYPERLGATRDEIASQLEPRAARFTKRSFSCLGAEGLREHLDELGREQIVVAGIETHVCVNQTTHELLREGFSVHLVRDAITSRFELDDQIGFWKMGGSGAIPTSVETLLFEWVVDSRAPEFKAIHRLVV